jgi:hypothetical protein
MPIQPRTVTDATTAAANWSKGVGAAGNKWADNYAHPSRNPFDPSVINPQAWQDGVSTDAAKSKYARKMAGVNQDMVLATVNGAGKNKYTSAATTRAPNVSTFMGKFIPQISSIVQNVNSTTPRGPRGSAQNLQRMNSVVAAIAALRNTF